MKNVTNVDAYLADFPEDTQKHLAQLREAIKTAAPDAEEVISYGMPTYKQNGPLVYFGAHSRHIGFYPTPSGIEKFKKELSGYKSSKGAVQFPLNEPLPLSLVSKIVAFRVKENKEKADLKSKLRKRAKA